MASPVIASDNSLVVFACVCMTFRMINIAMNSYLALLCLLNSINGNPYIVIQHSCIAASVEKQGCRLPNYRLPNGRLLNGRDCQTAEIAQRQKLLDFRLLNSKACWTINCADSPMPANIDCCLPGDSRVYCIRLPSGKHCLISVCQESLRA